MQRQRISRQYFVFLLLFNFLSLIQTYAQTEPPSISNEEYTCNMAREIYENTLAPFYTDDNEKQIKELKRLAKEGIQSDSKFYNKVLAFAIEMDRINFEKEKYKLRSSEIEQKRYESLTRSDPKRIKDFFTMLIFVVGMNL